MITAYELKRLRLLCIPIGLALLLLFVVAALPTGAASTQATPRTIPDEVNGSFAVSVLHGGKWHPVGSLDYGRHSAARVIDLSGLDVDDLGLSGAVQVRLAHEGMTAAYLDAILLDGRAPYRIHGAAEATALALRKAARPDFDLIDVGGRTLTFSFQPHGPASSLSLTARIQPEFIPHAPFHFPRANLLQAITEDSVFYTYRLNSARGHLTLDGELWREALGTPFFQAFCRTGTGHPAGTTYGWVSNDDENLYVAIDFVPDNTMDGDEDYAKVYVKTSTGVKAFKASVPEQQWGVPGFTYTPRADYQHKVYEFRLPLSSFGLGPAKTGTPVKLAFAAYGTAAEPMFVLQSQPAPNAVGVPLGAQVSAVFEDQGKPPAELGWLVTTTVSTRTFVVHGMLGGQISGTFSFPSTDTLVLAPHRSYHEGEIVRVSATYGIFGQRIPLPGGSILQLWPEQWQFTAGTVATRCVGGFTDIGAALPPVSHSSVAWGDYDQDGDLDILLTGLGGPNPMSPTMSVIVRNAGGVFTVDNPASSNLPGVAGGSVAWGDYDNDTDLDILLTGNKGTEAVHVPLAEVYLNNGGGPFTIEVAASAALTDVFESSVAWGDYNNDGDLDILLSGNMSSTGASPLSALYRSAPGGPVVDPATGLFSDTYKSSVAWGDHDRSGAIDVLLTGYSGTLPLTEIYRNSGYGFSPPSYGFSWINAGLLQVGAGAATWADFDMDGKLDILLTGNSALLDAPVPVPVSKVYRNLGTGKFVDINAGLTGVMNSSVAWGDYDNDGDQDILLAGFDGTAYVTKVYRNDGLSGFTDIGAGLPGVSHGSLAWGDYDGDNDLDILLTGGSADGPISRIYRNDDCADLSIHKAADPVEVLPGEPLTYTLTFSNAAGPGSVTATGIIISDAIPPELTSLSYEPSTGLNVTPTGGVSYTWQVPDLAPGEGGAIVVTGVVTTCLGKGTEFGNIVTITSTTLDDDDDNNSSAVVVTITNQPPLAVDDAYQTALETILTVSAEKGTLANDTDLNCDPLTVTWNSTPTHGTLDLSADGSFVFTPTAGYAGADAFAYRANDGLADSDVATVTITVAMHKVFLPLILRGYP